MSEQFIFLQALCEEIKQISDWNEKINALKRYRVLVDHTSLELLDHYSKCSPQEKYAILSVFAIGQAPIVFQDIHLVQNINQSLQELTGRLVDIEKFYDFMGGIIGYHLMVLTLIQASKEPLSKIDLAQHKTPEGPDLSSDTPETRRMVRWGIESLGLMSEVYPIGGAGDRLGLVDEVSGQALPAAELVFCGWTLLEWLIRDLQGREFLYHQLFGKQLHTPVLMMTSQEKNNRQHIERLLEKHQWFHRHKANFTIFEQIRVPALTMEGNWAMGGPLQPILKPGGHGAIWKAAADAGVFDRLKKSSHQKMLVRQINNPIAGIDKGLLALIGIGCHENKAFGFASCERLVNAPEGMNVLREKINRQKNAGREEVNYGYCITNIEYTDFKAYGIEDAPKEPGCPYSQYPANTNILFVDLPSLESALQLCQLPGLLINMKSQFPCYIGETRVELQPIARLESSMQNIADYIVDEFPKALSCGQFDRLRTFLTYNERKKNAFRCKAVIR